MELINKEKHINCMFLQNIRENQELDRIIDGFRDI